MIKAPAAGALTKKMKCQINPPKKNLSHLLPVLPGASVVPAPIVSPIGPLIPVLVVPAVAGAAPTPGGGVLAGGGGGPGHYSKRVREVRVRVFLEFEETIAGVRSTAEHDQVFLLSPRSYRVVCRSTFSGTATDVPDHQRVIAMS